MGKQIGQQGRKDLSPLCFGFRLLELVDERSASRRALANQRPASSFELSAELLGQFFQLSGMSGSIIAGDQRLVPLSSPVQLCLLARKRAASSGWPPL